ncbi:zinc-binding alcohol dehydrogenase family protein [Catenulispora sp. NL8]|uniref:Zinc-binding alcohol dehydrogenase family protein n=2 Tax=Catenulispora pinistramenti TaxID=2705254 RepID=A0ABS5KK74_9ACTN|nr:zinc-binding alcohol dehydrogenase family protein [Catenulispora pinistramenti]MBS2545631.1 zinc-binding alcohol dehydrogenase family protein [Catenulispora pinistramenti]
MSTDPAANRAADPAAEPAVNTAVNTAAWIPAKRARLEVGPAPYTPPAADQIVIRNRAVGVNPLDWIIQVEPFAYRWLGYPTVLGSDVAGEVVEVGAAVTRFQAGDRVLAHAVGTDKDADRAAEGAFQLYTVALERMASPLPDTMPFAEAAVLPMAVSTASVALFQTDHLALRHPSARPEPTGQTVLVWGGATSVGGNAVQLAAAAGYEVIATCSPRNFEYVQSLGAARVFDYNSPDAVADITAAFAGRTLAGAIAFGTTGAAACVRIAGACQGTKFVSIATPPVSFAPADNTGRLARPRMIGRMIGGNIGLQLAARRRGVRTKYIFGTSLKANEVSLAVYRDFLPAALAEGRYAAAPKPMVVGHGVKDFQHAMDVQLKGVSAAKVVVTLD